MAWYEAAQPITLGQVVAARPDPDRLRVVPATASNLAEGWTPFGIALAGATVPGVVPVAETGLIRPGVTGLAEGDPGAVGISAVGGCARVNASGLLVGVADRFGNLTLCIGRPGGSVLQWASPGSSTLEAELSTLRAEVRSLTGQLAVYASNVAYLEQSLTSLQARVSAIEEGGHAIPSTDEQVVVTETWPAVHFASAGLFLPDSQEKLRLLENQTIEAWVYLDAAPASGSLTTLYDKHVEAEGWFHVDDARHPRIWLGNPLCSDRTAIATDLTIPVGVWTHVAVVVDRMTAGDVRFYMNGIASTNVEWANGNRIGTGALSALDYMRTRCNTPAELGSRAGGHNALTGRLAEVRVWVGARDRDASGNATDGIANAYKRRVTQAEKSSLAGYWPMDEGAGLNIGDASNHGLGGTLPADATWVEGPTVSGGTRTEERVTVRAARLSVASATLRLVSTSPTPAPAVLVLNQFGGAIEGAAVSWSSSDERIASVDASGLVTGRSSGSATLTASYGGLTATCAVTVSLPVIATSVTWRALQLMSASSAIMLPRVSALQLVGALTIELWLRPDRLADEQAVVMTDHDSYGFLQLSTPSNLNTSTVGEQVQTYLVFYYGHDGGPRTRVYIETRLTVGAWFHLAVVRDTSSGHSQTVRFYINGKLEYAEQVTDTRPVALLPHYTWRLSTYQALLGAVSDFRLWNVARTDAQILDNFDRRQTGTETGLIGYYRLDETGRPSVAAHATDATLNAEAVDLQGISEGPKGRASAITA